MTPTQQRLHDLVICRAAMGDQSVRRILQDLRGEADAADLRVVEEALRKTGDRVAQRSTSCRSRS